MILRRFSRNTNSKTPMRILLVTGICSACVAAIAVLLLARAVQADAFLPRPTVIQEPPPVIADVTPESLAPRKTLDPLHGFASWYGGYFNGRRTASGEIFNMYAMTACHPTLPFGTLVRVTNRENRKSVVVRITDRGYLFRDRILDISYGAAKRLSMLKPGVTMVDLQVISWGENNREDSSPVHPKRPPLH